MRLGTAPYYIIRRNGIVHKVLCAMSLCTVAFTSMLSITDRFKNSLVWNHYNLYGKEFEIIGSDPLTLDSLARPLLRLVRAPRRVHRSTVRETSAENAARAVSSHVQPLVSLGKVGCWVASDL